MNELSNDQLSALLGQVGTGADGSEGITAEEAKSIDYSALQWVLEKFADRMQHVLTTVLNRKITCEIVSCEKSDADKVASVVSGETLDIQMPLSGGLQGVLHLLMTKKDVAILSDLMMLGDGTAPYNDDHKDAIVELANQFFGAYISHLNSEGLNPPASVGTIAVHEGRLPRLPIADVDSIMTSIRVKAEGVVNTTSILFLPFVIGEALTQRMASPSTSLVGSEASMQEAVGLSDSELSDLAKVGEVLESSHGFVETPFSSTQQAVGPKENIEMLLDIELDVTIELGQANLSIKRILELAPGSIIELNRMAGEPVDLLVNNKIVAKGEVVVVDENFGVRIVSLVSAEDRIRSLR